MRRRRKPPKKHADPVLVSRLLCRLGWHVPWTRSGFTYCYRCNAKWDVQEGKWKNG